MCVFVYARERERERERERGGGWEVEGERKRESGWRREGENLIKKKKVRISGTSWIYSNIVWERADELICCSEV